MAEAAAYSKDLCDELECSICRDIYTDPVSLSCRHVFCRGCLIAMYEQTVSQYEEPADWYPLVCAVCRKSQFTNLSQLGSMPVNLKLRNIVDALAGIKERCEEHQKVELLYCADCNEGKCLTCFIENCFPDQHSVEEHENVMKRLKIELSSQVSKFDDKIETVEAEIEQMKYEVFMQLRAFLPGSFSQMLEKVEHESLTELDEEAKDLRKRRKQLLDVLNSSDVRLLKNKIGTNSIPGSELPELFHTLASIAHTLRNSIKTATDKLKEFLSARGVNPTRNLTEIRHLAGITIEDYGSESPDLPTQTRGFSADARPVNLTLSPAQTPTSSATTTNEERLLHRPDMIQGVARSITPIYHTCLGGTLVNSISYIDPQKSFLANTSDGCLQIKPGEDPAKCFDGSFVKNVCVVSPNKLLVLVMNSLQLHETCEGREQMRLVFTLPLPATGLRKGCDFECIGSIGPQQPHYVVSENRNGLIYVWNCEARRWRNKRIDIGKIIGESVHQLTFKMCAHKQNIFFTVYHRGEIRCIDKEGETKWRNVRVSRKPCGVAADDHSLYVCEGERYLSCVIILNLDGTLRRIFTSPAMKRPYSLAIGNGQVAVLERFFRHNVTVSPINILLFNARN